MKKTIIISSIILVLVVVIGAYFATSKTTNKSSNVATQTSTKSELQQIKDNMKTGAILVDVRTPEEYALEHAKDSVNLQLADIQNGITPNVHKDTTVYLYCRSGRRATEAKAILEKEGFTKVVNITSLDRWKSLGGETVKQVSLE